MSSSIAAGVYTGLSMFLDAAAFATVVFAPAGLPLDVGIQHALLGFVLMQSVGSFFSASGKIITPISYEVMPFLARFASIASKTVSSDALLPTVFAGSMLVSFAAALLCGFLSLLPIGGGVEKLLPPTLQAGLFAAMGWGLYTLSYETLGFEGDNLPFSPVIATAEAARLWLPAHILGLGLWLASKQTASPALFPGFVVGVTILTHAVRVGTGTSLEDAQASHWLMASTSGRPCVHLFESAYKFDAVRWDVILAPDALKELLCALLFGPMINTVLNLVLIGPVIEDVVALPTELRAHAAGAMAAAIGGGYSNYVAVSNTAIHRKCGGLDRLSCYCAAAIALLFLVVHPLFAVVGYVPTLVVAAICVYIGADFLWDNLVVTGMESGLGSALASWAILAICLLKDMLYGVVLGIIAFQLHAAFFVQKAPAMPKSPAMYSKKKQ